MAFAIIPYFNGIVDIDQISAIYLGENATSYHTIMLFKNGNMPVRCAFTADKAKAQEMLEKIIEAVRMETKKGE